MSGFCRPRTLKVDLVVLMVGLVDRQVPQIGVPSEPRELKLSPVASADMIVRYKDRFHNPEQKHKVTIRSMNPSLQEHSKSPCQAQREREFRISGLGAQGCVGINL